MFKKRPKTLKLYKFVQKFMKYFQKLFKIARKTSENVQNLSEKWPKVSENVRNLSENEFTWNTDENVEPDNQNQKQRWKI